MAYGGNRGGGRGQQRQGGGYGGGRRNNNSRGGGNSRGNAQGNDNYIYSSAFVKNFIPEGGAKERVYLEEGLTEEVTFTLTPEKAQDFIDKIQDAQNDPDGDGGLRISLYCNARTNEQTGEAYDSASIMVLGKFPPQNGGRQYGNSRGGGGGRRDYSTNGQGRGGNSRGQQEQDSPRGGQRSNNSDRGRGGNAGGQQRGGRNTQQDDNNNQDDTYSQRGMSNDSSFGADDIPF